MMSGAPSEKSSEGKVETCPSCDGNCWSRSARGRCTRCQGTGSIVVGADVADSSPGEVPALGKVSEHASAKPPHIARACLVAQRDLRELGGAKRSAFSQAGDYAYADAEEIISLAGDVLLPMGVAPSIDHVEVSLDPTGARRLAVTCQLEHAESGEVWQRVRHVAVTWGDEQTLGQAENAAETNAFSYFLRDTLAIPRGYRSADVVFGPRSAPDTSPVIAPPTAGKASKGKGAAPSPQASAEVVGNALASEMQSAQSVAELDVVIGKLRTAVKRKEIGNREHVMLVDLAAEQRPRVEANDAGRAHEGSQTGRAA